LLPVLPISKATIILIILPAILTAAGAYVFYHTPPAAAVTAEQQPGVTAVGVLFVFGYIGTMLITAAYGFYPARFSTENNFKRIGIEKTINEFEYIKHILIIDCYFKIDYSLGFVIIHVRSTMYVQFLIYVLTKISLSISNSLHLKELVN
jgi:hypothetical protein